MRFRQLGRSGLTVSAVGLGCNNIGRTLDVAATRKLSSTPPSTPGSRCSTPPTSTAATGRRVRGDPRRGAGGPAGRRGAGHQVRHGHGRGERAGLGRPRLPAVHPARGRGVPAPAAYRPHRPVPVPRAGRGDPDRGDPRRPRRAGRRGQGPLRRLLQLRRLAARPGRPRRPGDRRDPLRQRPERVQPARPAGRGRAGAGGGRRTASACCRSSRSRTACSPASTAAAPPPPPGTRIADRKPALHANAPWDVIEGLERYAAERGATLLDVAIGGLARPAGGGVGDRRRQLRRAGPRERPAGGWEPSEADLAVLDEIAPRPEPVR